jgi:hypothetical protein
MTRMPPPDLSEPQFLMLSLSLRRGLGPNAHRRFYAQMRRALRPMDLLLCRCRGMCLMVQLGRQPPYDFRLAVMGWLINQHESKYIVLRALIPAGKCLRGDVDLHDYDDQPLPEDLLEMARELFHRLLASLFKRWLVQRAQLGLVAP